MTLARPSHVGRLVQELRRPPRELVLWALLAALLVVHLVQVFGPMRLDLDTIGYLNRTVEIVDGAEFGPTWLPPGYSYMLAGLDYMGLGTARAFAGLNFLFLCLGVFCAHHVLRQELELRRATALLTCCLFLLSFVLVKYAPLAIADVAYFGLSMGILLLFSRFRRARGPAIVTLLLIIAGTLLAIATRAVGVALAAGIVGVAWSRIGSAHAREQASEADRRSRIGLLVAAGLLVAVAIVYVLNSSYWDKIIELYRYFGAMNELSNTAKIRLRNWGELSMNAPTTVLPAFLHGIVLFGGLAGIALVLYGIYVRRANWGPAEAYFLAFLLILMIYPGHQTRYWLPVIPLMVGWAAVAVRSFATSRAWWAVVAIYLAGYAITGTGALVYSTRITLAGPGIGHVYGDGTLTYIYEAAFEGHSLNEDDYASYMHRYGLLLLRRYEPRTASVTDQPDTPDQ